MGVTMRIMQRVCRSGGESRAVVRRHWQGISCATPRRFVLAAAAIAGRKAAIFDRQRNRLFPILPNWQARMIPGRYARGVSDYLKTTLTAEGAEERRE